MFGVLLVGFIYFGILRLGDVMDRNEYEEDLKRRQKEHLQNVERSKRFGEWKPCVHDNCPECVGTYVKKDGTNFNLIQLESYHALVNFLPGASWYFNI